jgi:voltage-gated potassium channel
MAASAASVRRRSVRRRGRSFWARAAFSAVVIVSVVSAGAFAMHELEGWSYLDSFYFVSFIATGQGPPGNLLPMSATGKVAASLLAFISVGTVVTALLFLLGPFLKRVAEIGEEKLEKVEHELESAERGHEQR